MAGDGGIDDRHESKPGINSHYAAGIEFTCGPGRAVHEKIEKRKEV